MTCNFFGLFFNFCDILASVNLAVGIYVVAVTVDNIKGINLKPLNNTAIVRFVKGFNSVFISVSIRNGPQISVVGPLRFFDLYLNGARSDLKFNLRDNIIVVPVARNHSYIGDASVSPLEHACIAKFVRPIARTIFILICDIEGLSFKSARHLSRFHGIRLTIKHFRKPFCIQHRVISVIDDNNVVVRIRGNCFCLARTYSP